MYIGNKNTANLTQEKEIKTSFEKLRRKQKQNKAQCIPINTLAQRLPPSIWPRN